MHHDERPELLGLRKERPEFGIRQFPGHRHWSDLQHPSISVPGHDVIEFRRDRDLLRLLQRNDGRSPTKPVRTCASQYSTTPLIGRGRWAGLPADFPDRSNSKHWPGAGANDLKCRYTILSRSNRRRSIVVMTSADVLLLLCIDFPCWQHPQKCASGRPAEVDMRLRPRPGGLGNYNVGVNIDRGADGRAAGRGPVVPVVDSVRRWRP